LKQINFFLEQVVQNTTTWFGTLQKVKLEQIKENLFETHNHLQTYSLKLKIVQKILKNYDKELVKVKGQMNRVQHENQNLSNKLKKA
jgi:septal ring factor EnvC (AmiA/AmiB activator)